MKLENKIIWILSPNRWGKMKVSKHHYALTLAARNNIVYFIEPPSLENKGIIVKPSDESDNLFIVSYKPIFRGKNFLPKFIYRWLLHKQVRLFRKEIPRSPDVLWCFYPFLFENLNWYGARMSILHVMDLSDKSSLPSEAKSADLIIGVSSSILDWLKPSNKNLFFVNHGLGKAFTKKANTLLLQKEEGKIQKDQRLKVGYIGNLLMEAPDRSTMMKIIRQHQEIDFIFWGQHENNDNNLGSWYHEDVPEFINFLKTASNVTLEGSQKPEKILEKIDNIDIFWICWKIGISYLWDGSNSHKILEYLATGKPVVAHHIKTYKDSNLIYMLPVDTNENYPALFQQVIDIVTNGEDQALKNKRIEFALENTYEKQVDRIEEIINKVKPENDI